MEQNSPGPSLGPVLNKSKNNKNGLFFNTFLDLSSLELTPYNILIKLMIDAQSRVFSYFSTRLDSYLIYIFGIV